MFTAMGAWTWNMALWVHLLLGRFNQCCTCGWNYTVLFLPKPEMIMHHRAEQEAPAQPQARSSNWIKQKSASHRATVDTREEGKHQLWILFLFYCTSSLCSCYRPKGSGSDIWFPWSSLYTPLSKQCRHKKTKEMSDQCLFCQQRNCKLQNLCVQWFITI